MGRRMSGRERWASMLPSMNSTMPCTMLWGWTRTLIFSMGVSKSQWASMTSSPLFMSVAESMVILLPMLHFG